MDVSRLPASLPAFCIRTYPGAPLFDLTICMPTLRRFVDGVIELHYPDAHYPRIHRQTRQVFKVVGAIFPKQGKRGRWSSNQQP